MEMNSLHDLLVDDLRDLYNAENQIIKALPKMAKAASSPELKSAFQEHLEQTHEQVQRLEQVFQEIGEKVKGKKCRGMEGIIDEGKEMLSQDAAPEVLDAALIESAQKVEHYEMAGYGSARTYARLLGNNKAARLLQETLDEEGLTDKKLTQLAESLINLQAKEAQA